MSELEKYFCQFRDNIVGIDQEFVTPYGRKKLVYADWVASGRLYEPIEKRIFQSIGPFVGNTHTETSITGTSMTAAYHYARDAIKKHVNAGPEDVLITPGFGMTAAVNKLQRLLGLRVPERYKNHIQLPERKKPVVFVTHMEHHSNQISWLETIADLIVVPPNKEGLVDLNIFEDMIKKFKDREEKYAAVTACSNVTGIQPPIHQIAALIHRYGGYAFVDFAASAPYVDINMHPKNPDEKLDAIFFSPHKFLGGPGSSGVLICDVQFCARNKVPDHPGGDTVDWTNPWGGVKYRENIEAREDGGTPGFLQAMRSALAIKLKEKMGTDKIHAREKELIPRAFDELSKIEGINLLAKNVTNRLGIISFYFKNIHYNLIVKLLNDRFGIQVRGGCLCAGTYGHFLLGLTPEESKKITDEIDRGDWSHKPGWVRISIHPTMTDDELSYITDALKETVKNINRWSEDYWYDKATNEFYHKNFKDELKANIPQWFEL